VTRKLAKRLHLGTRRTVGTLRVRIGSAGQKRFTIKLDKTAPNITASATKADGTAYTAGSWTNQNVTVSFTPPSGGSVSGYFEPRPAVGH
jgi:hypothetical protein